MKIINVLIAPDSFKGSLSSKEVCVAVEKGIKNVSHDFHIRSIPIADGGEGTMDSLVAATQGVKKVIECRNPVGKNIQAEFGILGDGNTCVIEIASASGLFLISEGERNPFKTTSFGTGQLIKAGLDHGCREFIIGLGGSATNDGGSGILQALGMRLLDKDGNDIGYGGESLRDVASIDESGFDERIAKSKFILASDVENPLIGPTGASHIFGSQKGASQGDHFLLDSYLSHWADVIESKTDKKIHEMPGAGAAGGIGGVFQAFFLHEFKRGIDIVLDIVNFDDELKKADIVITGEGEIDAQTIYGKAPLGVAQAASRYDIPVIAIAGTFGEGTDILFEHGISSIFSILDKPRELNDSMQQAPQLIEKTTEQIFRLITVWNRTGLLYKKKVFLDEKS